MDDLRYGEEKLGLETARRKGHNLSPVAAARLVYNLDGSVLTEGEARRFKLLARDLRRLARNLSGGLSASGMPAGTQIWSKAGRTLARRAR